MKATYTGTTKGAPAGPTRSTRGAPVTKPTPSTPSGAAVYSGGSREPVYTSSTGKGGK